MKQPKLKAPDRSRKLKDVFGAKPNITNTGILSAKLARNQPKMVVKGSRK